MFISQIKNKLFYENICLATDSLLSYCEKGNKDNTIQCECLLAVKTFKQLVNCITKYVFFLQF